MVERPQGQTFSPRMARGQLFHEVRRLVKLGIDPVHFGILMTVNMEVGMCHPPVGLNLYVASGITKMGISELTVAVLPWLLAMVGFMLLITYVPIISLWLPHLLGY